MGCEIAADKKIEKPAKINFFHCPKMIFNMNLPIKIYFVYT
jgi:hypothetical protein